MPSRCMFEILAAFAVANGVCRDLRASRLAGLFPGICVPTSDRMEIKPQWETGPDIRVVDAKLCEDRWIVKANASVEARCPGCRIRPQRRHSAYVQRLQDYPSKARPSSFR